MSEVTHNVQLEPHALHPLSGENLRYHSAIQDDDARVDIKASSFWRCLYHHTFFDVRNFNCFAASNSSSTLVTVLQKHKLEKCHASVSVRRGAWIMEVLPPCFFYLRRHGKGCYHHLQMPCSPAP